MPRITVLPRAPRDFLTQFPEYPESVTSVLFNRGLRTPEEIESFLEPSYEDVPDPYLFQDMQKACDRIAATLENKERVAVFGDYDADGVSASSILFTVLTSLGLDVEVYIPHREKEGYGMNTVAVDYLNEKNVKLIITCDCGISNRVEVAYATEKGIDTIVTDHHQMPEQLPDAYAIIHPKRPGESYPDHNLAGGGVAFKLAQGVLRHSSCKLSESEREATEKWMLDLVALSSVADMVPLLGENRILTHYGLLVLQKNRRLGMKMLLERAAIDPLTVSSETISFGIAPRVNAAGRMDHANTAFALMTTTVPNEASSLADQLEGQNRERQKQTEVLCRAALQQIDKSEPVSIAYEPSWSAGLTGLVAGKILRDVQRPVFILCSDGTRIVGSGRAPDGINILEAIVSAKDLLQSYGGHPQACGFRLPMESYDPFIRHLRTFFEPLRGKETTAGQITVDGEITLDEITWGMSDVLQKIEPFGQGNPEPVWLARDVELIEQRTVGQQSNHSKLLVRQKNTSKSAIAFKQVFPHINPGDRVDIVFMIRPNQWNGTRELQLVISSLQPHV